MLSDKEIKQGYYFKFNTGMLLRADLKTQVESLTKGIANFLYTPNEARAYLDLEAKDGGDELIGNGSTIKVSQIGMQYKNSSNGSTEPLDIEDEGGDE